MSPLEELIAAELSREQKNDFIGSIAATLDSEGAIDGLTWSAAIKHAKESGA